MYWTNKIENFGSERGCHIVMLQSTKSFHWPWKPQVLALSQGKKAHFKILTIFPRCYSFFSSYPTTEARFLLPSASGQSNNCWGFLLYLSIPPPHDNSQMKRGKRDFGPQNAESESPCWALLEVENVFRILIVLSRIQIWFSQELRKLYIYFGSHKIEPRTPWLAHLHGHTSLSQSLLQPGIPRKVSQKDLRRHICTKKREPETNCLVCEAVEATVPVCNPQTTSHVTCLQL